VKNGYSVVDRWTVDGALKGGSNPGTTRKMPSNSEEDWLGGEKLFPPFFCYQMLEIDLVEYRILEYQTVE
jgi:hypothetical protein